MKRHRTDAISLTFGAIFLLIAGWWTIGRSIDIALPAFGWLLALGLIAVGGLGLVGALRGGPDRERVTSSDGWPAVEEFDDR